MSAIYRPHPWDALPADPPAPGLDYSDALDPLPVKDALRAAALFREADALEDQARRYEDDARDLRGDAGELIATIREQHPILADAIEEDPATIGNEADVRRAAHPEVGH